MSLLNVAKNVKPLRKETVIVLQILLQCDRQTISTFIFIVALLVHFYLGIYPPPPNQNNHQPQCNKSVTTTLYNANSKVLKYAQILYLT